MKVLSTRIGLAMAVAVALLPTPAAGQTPTEDAVTGLVYVTAELCVPIPGRLDCSTPDLYLFDAHSGPAGENPRGTVAFTTGERVGLLVDPGAVTCLAVSGRRASIGVNFEGFTESPMPLPHSAILFVEDNGGEGLDKLAVQDLPQPGTAPSVCPDSLPAGLQLGQTYTRMFSDLGSVTVTDAPGPLPTTKDQCKHGGWARFGFENQGRCIRFVRLIPGPGPYPSSRAECQHGGWAQFGFKDKRRCLRFVRLRPNP